MNQKMSYETIKIIQVREDSGLYYGDWKQNEENTFRVFLFFDILSKKKMKNKEWHLGQGLENLDSWLYHLLRWAKMEKEYISQVEQFF